MKKQSYTTEYKIDVAKMAIASARDGGSIAAAARIMGLHQSMVNKWVHQFKDGFLKVKIKKVEPKKSAKSSGKEEGGGDQVKVLKSIDRTLKKILTALEDQQPPSALVDLVAGAMNGESQTEEKGE